MDKVLEVKQLTVSIENKHVISDVDLFLCAGEIVALVGESGSGKTLTGLSTLDLLPQICKRQAGEVLYLGRNVFDMTCEEKRKTRGARISMVFQEPFTSLNPVMACGRQIAEQISAHKKLKNEEINKKVDHLLEIVKLNKHISSSYPHELSGGMRQRVMLAMALSCNPKIIIMDEPTTALDVSIQKDILDLIKTLQEKEHFGVLFITHDFSIVNMIADRVYVMKNGKVVEEGSKDEVLKNPKDEYTCKLLGCIPRLGDKRKRLPV